MSKAYPKRAVGSLLSMSIECVATNLLIHTESLKYLPICAKDRILRKFLASHTSWKHLISNKTLSVLLYPNLKSIDLSSIKVDDDTLNTLKTCHGLTDIKLRNYGNRNISSKGLKNLFEQTKNLLVLDVSHCKEFNDDVLTFLSLNCHKLRELNAEGCDITDDGFVHLTRNNKKLRCLTISETKISGEGISNAIRNKCCCHLQEFRLDNCSKIDDEVLKIIIQNCPKMEILTFYNCSITDETSIFQDITKTCKNLKQLHWTITW